MDNSKKTSTSVLENFLAKERSTNFSKEESDRLQSLVGKYKDILFCKKTDGTSAKQKDHVWHCIEKAFNANGEIPRSMKQLKYKFDNMKRAVKKEATSVRQHMIKTGGGRLTPPPPLPEQDHDTADWLRTIMSSSIHGNEAVYDDDVIAMPSIIDEELVTYQIVIEDDLKKSNVVEKIDEIKLPESLGINTTSSQCVYNTFDTSTPHSSLKRPMSSPLKRLAKRKKENDGNLIKRALHEKKLTVLDGLHDLEYEKIRDSISQQRELHEQTLKHSNEKHQLEMLKLQLEVDILKCKKIKRNE